MPNTYQDELTIRLNKQTADIVAKMPDFSHKFFDSLKDKNSSPRTRLQYAYDMLHFFSWLKKQAGFKDRDLNGLKAADILDQLTVEDLQEYASSLETYINKEGKERLYSNEARARRLSSLRSFYRYYFKIGEIKNNMADLIDIPRIPDKEILAMDYHQVQRLLDAVNDESGLNPSQKKHHQQLVKRDFAIVMTFLGTGIRVSELVGINVSDVDFYNASILVTRKGGDQDLVYFGQEVEDALLDYIDNGRETLHPSSEETALFISTRGTRITARSVELIVKKYAARAGINTKTTPHSLRRTYGTNLYNETGDIYLVADALHHSSVETTQKHYAKMSTNHKREAARYAETILKKDQ